ncbi:hypothetical protein EV646_116148 [Kribbella antiqua]|uniref:Uncharacterized protein n=1 Tax=Kribbella antiqua TaxID=2512217 RepID=A0A4R2IAG5_9ACTN|nr:hypothetical protein [Kribbella antiqua]TCO41056.1 hypothetical protein EV646_116148 [Kribbella antiqua]
MVENPPASTPEPNWYKPFEIRYSIAFNDKAWRKVHPPHLAAAVAAGEAAIRAHLQSVTPVPYSVAEVEAQASYSRRLWDSEWEYEEEGVEEPSAEDLEAKA